MIKKNTYKFSIILLLVFTAGSTLIWWIAQSTDKRMRSILLDQARITAMSVNINRITSLSGSAKDINTPDYTRVKSQLMLMRNAKYQCRFLYLLGQRPDGQIFFFLDSLPVDSKDYASPGLIYDEVSDSYLRVFATMQEDVVGPITDRWGTLITALIPIKHSDTGDLIAVLGMDIDAANWNKTILLRCAFPITTFLLVAILILTLISRDLLNKAQLEREKKHRLFFENSPIGIIHYNHEGIITDVNEAMINTFGSSYEKLVGLDIDDIPDKKFSKEVNRSLDGEPGHFEGKYISHTGKKTSYLKADWIPIKKENAMIAGIGIVEDITERKLAEIKLKESTERHTSLLDAINKSGIALFIVDKEYYVRYMNELMIQSFGNAIGKICYRDIGGSDSPCSYCQLTKVIDNGEIVYYEPTLADGRIFAITAVPYTDVDGTHCKLEIIRDITEFKRIETQLQQALKIESIGTLAGGIAHDFNNILFPIIGHSEMLLMDVPVDSPMKNGLNQIYTGALRASDLVKQILTFSRKENSEFKLMNMQPVVKEALKLIRSTIPTTIVIKQNIQPDCGVIKADPTQIHQVVMNLCTNAYHVMEDTGGELKISLKKVEFKEPDLLSPGMQLGTYACLSISDTGKGMDKELTEKIFDPFFTTKEIGKGTGMGLSVVYGIIKNMDGAIKVCSEPDKGTEFHVYLPLSEAVKEQQVSHAKTLIRGGTERILLVDDEDAIITMEKLMLERLGYQVTSRTSSIEALEDFRDNPDKFDLVITDMAMPNMSGDKLSVELNKILPGIPVLLCTGFSETMSEEQAASMGIKGFLLKPIVMNDLAKKIREVLGENKS